MRVFCVGLISTATKKNGIDNTFPYSRTPVFLASARATDKEAFAVRNTAAADRRAGSAHLSPPPLSPNSLPSPRGRSLVPPPPNDGRGGVTWSLVAALAPSPPLTESHRGFFVADKMHQPVLCAAGGGGVTGQRATISGTASCITRP